MKLIVIRDENARFFKSYWKKWYELGRGRQQLRLEERQQALHDLMEDYDWHFDGKNFTEGKKVVELSYKLYKVVRPRLQIYSAEQTLSWMRYYDMVSDECPLPLDEPIRLDVDVELSSTDVEYYKRRMKISKEDVCYNDFEEFENDVLIRVIGEIKDDLIKQFVRASVYMSCLYYLKNGTEDDMECMEVYLGEDGSLEELKRELPSMADIAEFEERYQQEVGG